MILTNDSDIGVDSVINDIQEELYDKITSLWSGTIDGYGRLYKNKRDGSYIPEYYHSKNDYKPIYYNDKVDGQFFFLVDDTSDTEDSVVFTVKCKCVFSVNIVNVLGSGRNDQEAHRDVVEVLRDINGNYDIKGIETTVEDVFRGYNTESIKHSNINPKHTFSVNLDLNYYLTNKCN
jgi:hypothetical protein